MDTAVTTTTALDIKTIIMVVSPLLIALAGAVTFLFKFIKSIYEKLAKDHQDCEERHLEKDKVLLDVQHRVGVLEGKAEVFNQLHQEVLAAVHKKGKGDELRKNTGPG